MRVDGFVYQIGRVGVLLRNKCMTELMCSTPVVASLGIILSSINESLLDIVEIWLGLMYVRLTAICPKRRFLVSPSPIIKISGQQSSG